MKSNQSVKKIEFLFPKPALVFLLASLACATAFQRTEAATNLLIWDTGSRFGNAIDTENRTGWIAVPSELFVFEKNPPQAASDPGYYGREYSFKGDAIVENRSLTAVFWSAKGRVVLYSKADMVAPNSVAQEQSAFGRKLYELVPLQFKSKPAKITRCEIVRNAADEVVVEVSFAGPGSESASALLSFGRNEIIEIKPSAKMKGISLLSSIEYGVVPSFIGDDLIFRPAEYESSDALFLPAENVFVALLKGEGDELIMTWPKGKQQLSVRLADNQGKRVIQSVDFDNDGQSIYLSALSAPGIWHREELKPD